MFFTTVIKTFFLFYMQSNSVAILEIQDKFETIKTLPRGIILSEKYFVIIYYKQE